MEQVYEFTPHGTCSRKITIVHDGNLVKSVSFLGGCPGNTLGVGKLCEGRTLEELIPILDGILCGSKPTSCPNELCKALKEIQKQQD